MKLYKYEMKKLLLNRSRLMLLAAAFIIFTLMGFLSAEGALAVRKSKDYNEYIRLVTENTGKFNPEQFAESKVISEATETEYQGNYEDGFYMYLHRNPIRKFHRDYAAFGERVHEYWNGPGYQDKGNIMGVYPIQEKLKELSGNKDSYEYKYYTKRLNTELSMGEPVFGNMLFWNSFFLAFDPSRVGFLLMMLLAFTISPVFTQEMKTDMDSIVLCSLKGRREIVTAKLLCVCTVSAILTVLYFTGAFAGTLIFRGGLDGSGAPARCLMGYGHTFLDMTAAGAAMLGILWQLFASTAFGLAIAFISSKCKNQTTTFGLGVSMILVFALLGFLRDDLKKMLGPITEFNYLALSMYGSIFGEFKAYNVFGVPVSYAVIAFAVCLTLCGAACLLTYMAQKKRSAV